MFFSWLVRVAQLNIVLKCQSESGAYTSNYDQEMIAQEIETVTC